MSGGEALDGYAQAANAEQTGARFQDSRISLQAAPRKGCMAIQQIVIVEVWKSLGSAANE